MLNRCKKFLILSLLVSCMTSLACASEAGKFIAIEGKVDVLKAGADHAAPVFEGDAFSIGDIIRTKSLSKTEVKFKDGVLLKLAENTRLEVKEYKLNELGLRNNAIINLQRGEIRATVKKTVGDMNFFVNTPNASVSSGNSDIFVFYNKSATGAMVNDGIISIASKAFPDNPVNVSEGLISLISSGQLPQKPRPYMDIEKRRHDELTKTFRAPAQGDPSDIKAIAVKLSGDVKVRRSGTAAWSSVKLNDIFGSGDQIDTKDDGMIEIKLDNGNVITLKPNSSIMLTELKRDVKTGNYINLFDANIGNLRAKVQKLKGGSKFQIRTPTATASVRGTIMYLEISPGLTKVFFQGGTGIISSIISNITKAVHDGQTSSADGQGNVSDVTDASDAEQNNWTSGWDTPEAEPYTEPGPGAGLGEGGNEGGEGESGEGGTETSEDIPETIGAGEGGPLVDVPPDPIGIDYVEEPMAWSVKAKGHFGYIENGAVMFNGGYLDFIFGGTEPIEENRSASVTIIGKFKNPDNYTLWSGDFEGKVNSEASVIATTGGINFNGLLEGAIIGLYIRDDGEGGYRGGYIASSDEEGNFSTITGNFYDGLEMFDATGNLTAYHDGPTTVTPDRFYINDGYQDLGVNMIYTDGLVGGDFSGPGLDINYTDGLVGGDFSGEVDAEFVSLEDQDWGIWRAALGGNGGPNSPFTLALWGGSDNEAYWLGSISGDGESGKMWGSFKGIAFHQEVGEEAIGLIRMSGDIIGTYIDVDEPQTDNWQSLGVGEWVDVAEIDPNILGFDMADMANFVSVPITETYANLLQGSGAFDAGGTIAGIIDMSIFNNGNNEIWTALISGTYNGPIGDTWNLALQNGPDTINLAGNQWSDGEWLAGVSGRVDGNTIGGQAGGVYGDGEFQGAGAGTVNRP